MSLLSVQDLHVSVRGREVLHGVDLGLDQGEVHVLMGPNAVGKTTLAFALIGHPRYEVTQGRVLFKGVDLQGKGMRERVRMGIMLAYQHPPEIRGVKLRDLIRIVGGKKPWNPLEEPVEGFASRFLKRAGLDPELFLHRDLNVGFSGGERKRSELAQLLVAKPELLILDEIDSGVDVDSLRRITNEVNQLRREVGTSILMITHYRHILRYMRADCGHIIFDGRIILSGDPEELASRIEAMGYEAIARELGFSKV